MHRIVGAWGVDFHRSLSTLNLDTGIFVGVHGSSILCGFRVLLSYCFFSCRDYVLITLKLRGQSSARSSFAGGPEQFLPGLAYALQLSNKNYMWTGLELLANYSVLCIGS